MTLARAVAPPPRPQIRLPRNDADAAPVAPDDRGIVTLETGAEGRLT